MNQFYNAADFFLRWVHIVIAVFCVVGWIHPETRVYNFGLIILIAISWFGLGYFRGYGYCLVTDVQWRIKHRLGEKLTTQSFIKYELDRLAGRELDEKRVNLFTQMSFYLSAIASVFTNFLL